MSLVRVGILSVLLAVAAYSAQFEVASIKPNPNCGARRENVQGTPGRLTMECTTLEHAIQSAYGFYADGIRMNARLVRVSGGPAWASTERYNISATTDENVPRAVMYGPMLQTLLGDRFRLKVHRTTEEIPVYALTVAKGGPKMKPATQGTCIPVDANTPPATPAPGQPLPVYCGRPVPGVSGRNVTMDARGMLMTNLAEELLSRILDRPVVDKTGLDGLFDFHLEFTPDDATRVDDTRRGDTAATAPDPGALSVFTAVEKQLGLKLVPDKAAFGVLVIDSVERPTAN